MSDIIEGLGSVTQGGLFARALEPNSGAKDKHPEQPENCKNCGAELVGAYCHACGQKGHVHRTISAFMHDLLHGALHFEGKLWRTLPMLVFKPGKLTRRYIDGERARFVSPMALFLFGVFLMFAVFQVLGLTTPTDLEPDTVAEETVDTARDLARAEAAQLREDLENPNLTDAQRAEIEQGIAVAEAFLADSPEDQRTAVDAATDGFVDGFNDALAERENTTEAQTETQDTGGEVAALNLPTDETGIPMIDNMVSKWRENPSLMLYKLQANAYKFSWLLIPISIPFVWLTFAWRRRFRAYDHAIFVTYSLSFVTLLFITLSLLGAAGIITPILVFVAIFGVPIHLYKQLRHTYEIGRFGAFWRLIILSAFIWIIVGLFAQVLLFMGAF